MHFRVESKFEKQAGSVRNKSLARLKTEYERVKNFREQPTLLQLVVNEYLIKGMLLVCALVIGVAYFVVVYFIDNVPSINNAFGLEILKRGSIFMSLLIWLLTVGFILTFVFGLNNLLSDYSRLKQFDKFEKKSLARINELENLNKKKGA